MSQVHVIACVPVSEEGRAALVALVGPEPPPLPPVYPGSVREQCDACGQEVWVGPRQQELAASAPSAVLCFACVRTSVPGASSAALVSLDNPFVRAD